MFTRQASVITNALASSLPAASAQAMVQAMCNCAQTLEHRGPARFNFQQPSVELFPGLQPPPGRMEPYSPQNDLFPPITPGNVTIALPPWSPIDWQNIPFVDVPAGTNTLGEYGLAPHFPNPLTDPFRPQLPVEMPGGIGTGPIDATGPVTAPEVNTGAVHNYGDMFTDGDTFIGGDTFIDGGVTVAGDTVAGGAMIVGGDTVNEGPVFNNNAVNNFNEENHFGPAVFGGPVNIRRGPFIFPPGPVVVRNVRVQLCAPLTVYTRVWYDAAAKKLKGSRVSIRFLGVSAPLGDVDILVAATAGASFNNSECDLAEVANSPQITYVKSLAAGNS